MEHYSVEKKILLQQRPSNRAEGRKYGFYPVSALVNQLHLLKAYDYLTSSAELAR